MSLCYFKEQTQARNYYFAVFIVEYGIENFVFHCGKWTENVRPFLRLGTSYGKEFHEAAKNFGPENLDIYSNKETVGDEEYEGKKKNEGEQKTKSTAVLRRSTREHRVPVLR